MSSPSDYRPDRYSFPSLDSIVAAERVLLSVLESHVLVGGACVGFYVDDAGAAEVRPTDDVDAVVEIRTELERIKLDEKLRAAGLEPDMDGPICRWRHGDLKIDIMPSDSAILGFTNRWYEAALASSISIALPTLTLRIPDVCTFLGTKIEAFHGRGKRDLIASSDFEDIVRILDGCSFLTTESKRADPQVQDFVAGSFRVWLEEPSFIDAVSAHLMDSGDGARLNLVLGRIRAFVELLA